MSKISYIKSDDRKYNIERCLSLIKSEIMAGLKNAQHVVVKPNCIVENLQLASTHVDALDAVLDFIKPYAKGQIILAEGTSNGDTMTAFENYSYLRLQEKYDFAVVDLNTDEFETMELLDHKGNPWQARIAKTVLNSDYLISLSPFKTDDNVVCAGAIQNAAIGSLVRPENSFTERIAAKIGMVKNSKLPVHHQYSIINENIKRLANKIPIKLAVIDAFTAMNGDGPINGEMMPAHFAIASSDPIAADWLACKTVGIEIDDVGYLSLLDAGKEEYFVIGDDWQKNIQKFKMHSNFEKTRNWK